MSSCARLWSSQGLAIPIRQVQLFNGTDMNAWTALERDAPNPWHIEDEAMIVVPGSGSIRSRDVFSDCVITLEFQLPSMPEAKGQARSNSGVYIQDLYEIQILDSSGYTLGGEPVVEGPAIDGCGAIYKQRAPAVNACRAPGMWQKYQIQFSAARFDASGNKIKNARVKVLLNDVTIQENVEITGPTGSRSSRTETGERGPLVLQEHGCAVKFRNVVVWVPVAESDRASSSTVAGVDERDPDIRKASDGASKDTVSDRDAPRLPESIDFLMSDLLDFQPLFDGTTLTGWSQLGGVASYRAEDGCIIGTTRPSTPNSFLVTDREYDNFELDLEFKVDPGLNSGVQFRSESKPDYQNGRVHGYQAEIDPSERAWSAGIYDEGRREWLASLEKNPVARKAFKQDEWNQMKIVAIGPEMRTFLNGVLAAVLNDPMTPRGFIGLQVHDVGGRVKPLEVRWKNLRLREISPSTTNR